MKLKFIPGPIIVLLLVALPIFSHLDELPLQMWDEARLAENAFEMNQDHDYIVTHYLGKPDMWNTKPPLMIWLQVSCIKLIGMGEIAVRLPSALAALATCLLLYWFLARKLKTPLLGLFSCLVLVTVPGYVGIHGTRTGDYDSLLALFLTAYSMFFYLYLEEDKRKYLALAFAGIILAGLTKGVAGLLMLPALFLYTIYKKKLLITIKEIYLYAGIGSFVAVVLGYYLLREHYDHGYLQAVKNNELGGRYSKTLEDHNGGASFYFDEIAYSQFKYWFFLLVPGAVFGIRSKFKWLQDLTVLLLLLTISYFLIVNNAQTKIIWYVLPLYPFFSMIVAIFICGIYQLLATINVETQLRTNILPVVFIAFLCLTPYINIMGQVLNRKTNGGVSIENADMTQFLSDVYHGERNIDSCTVVSDMEQDIVCYRTMLSSTNKQIHFIGNEKFNGATRIVTSLERIKKYIDTTYYYEQLGTYNSVTIYKLDSMKRIR